MKDQASKLRRMVSESNTKDRLRIFSVISNSDNVGKTNYIMNLAVKFRKNGENVLVMDATGDSENLSNYINLSSIGIIDDNLESFNNIQDQIIMGPEGIDILLGAENLIGIKTLTKEKQNQALYKIKFFNKYDVIIIDNKAGFNNDLLCFLNFTNEIILISTPDIENILSTYGLIKVLASNKIKSDMNIVINKTKSSEEGLETFRKLENTSNRFLNIKLVSLGNLRFDEKLEESNKSRIPISIYDKDSIYNRNLDKIFLKIKTDKLIGESFYTIDEIETKARCFFEKI